MTILDACMDLLPTYVYITSLLEFIIFLMVLDGVKQTAFAKSVFYILLMQVYFRK